MYKKNRVLLSKCKQARKNILELINVRCLELFRKASCKAGKAHVYSFIFFCLTKLALNFFLYLGGYLEMNKA